MLVALLGGLVLLLRSPSEGPKAAEPAQSPAITARPAGRLVALPGQAEGVAVDPASGLAAIAVSRPPRLVVVDPARGRVVRSVALPSFARHLQPGDPGEVLVPAEQANALVRVDVRSGATRQIRVGEHPHDAALVAGRVVAGNEFGDSISIIEPGGAVRDVRTAAQPGGVAASGTLAAVVAVGRHVLETYDVPRALRLERVPAGRGPTHIAALPNGRVVVVDTAGDALLVFGLRPHLRLVARTKLAGVPYGIAVDAARRRLWVTLTAENRVAEVALTGGAPRLVRTLPTVRQPNGIAVDPRTGRVLITGREPGVLELIEP